MFYADFQKDPKTRFIILHLVFQKNIYLFKKNIDFYKVGKIMFFFNIN